VRVLEFAVITSTVSHCSAAAADPHRVHLVHGVGEAASQVHQAGAAEGGHQQSELTLKSLPALVAGLSSSSYGVRGAASHGCASATVLVFCAHCDGRLERGAGCWMPSCCSTTICHLRGLAAALSGPSQSLWKRTLPFYHELRE